MSKKKKEIVSNKTAKISTKKDFANAYIDWNVGNYNSELNLIEAK